MTLPTAEEISNIIKVMQKEVPCNDHSCDHCKLSNLIYDTDPLHNMCRRLIMNAIMENDSTLEGLTERIVTSLTRGILIGMVYMEAKKLDEICKK